MRISKDIKFDCAHLLSQYEGKCANLHGHTYHGRVTIIAAEPSIKTGMIMDYNKIKQIIDELDHAIIFSSSEYREDAEDKLLQWARLYGMRFIILDGKSTAEGIVHYLVKRFIGSLYYLGGKVTVEIQLSETDGSWVKDKGNNEGR